MFFLCFFALGTVGRMNQEQHKTKAATEASGDVYYVATDFEDPMLGIRD